MRFQLSQVTSRAGFRTLQPALLTRMSILPKWAMAAATICWMLSRDRTSRGRGRAWRPRDWILAWEDLSVPESRLVMMRSAPARARARAKVWPRPRLAPVTRAILPVREKGEAGMGKKRVFSIQCSVFSFQRWVRRGTEKLQAPSSRARPNDE